MATKQRKRPPSSQRRRPGTSPAQARVAPAAATQRNKRPRRRKHRNTGFFIRFLTMIAIVLAVSVGIILFFKINVISVQGNSIYSQQEIMDACGLEPGDNLVTISKSSIAGKIIAALPYVEQVRIARVLPDTVVISVKESDVAFTVLDETGGSWLINSSGKVLEQVDAAAAAEHPVIKGLTAVSPKISANLQAEPAESMTVATQLLNELEGTGLLSKISSINVEKTYDIELWYGDQYQIKLGGSDDLTYKITYLVAVLDQLDDYQTGVIDLTFDEKRVARFLPFEIEKS